MSFPSSPTNGQSTVVNGINYVYTSATRSWTRSQGSVNSLSILTTLSVGGNITANGFYYSNGSALGGGGTTITVDNFTANGVGTQFTLNTTPLSGNYTMVSLAGTLQPRTGYTVTGNLLTFSSAPPNTAAIEVTSFSAGGGGSSTSSARALGYSLVFGL
jgi:hypothetical protein